MTHLYTLLLGGLVIPGGGEPDATAIAWADDTVLAIGGDGEVRAISRGDSRIIDLAGRCVLALGDAALEVGAPADLLVLDRDPRSAAGSSASRTITTVAVIRGGRVVEGALPPGTAPATEHGSWEPAPG